MLAAPLAGSVVLGACGSRVPSMFRAESLGGHDIRTLAYVVFGILSAVAITVWVLLTIVIVRYRHRPESAAAQTQGNLLIEVVWTLIPAVIVAVLFALTVYTTGQLTGTSGPITFTSVGHQWWWELDYGTFKSANEIHVPVDRLVTAQLESADVIHSFWVPQMGGKVDMIPGHVNHLSFVPTVEGSYLGECSEFCGHQHGRMRFLLIVEGLGDFERWVDAQRRDAAEPSGAAAVAGSKTIQQLPCVGCHTIRGTPLAGTIGPDLTHVGSRRTLAAVTLRNTPADMTAWLRDPQQVKPQNLMPRVSMTSRQRLQLVAYLEGLK